MKTRTKNQQPSKPRKNPQPVEAVDTVIQRIMVLYPSMTAGKALTCAASIFSHHVGKTSSATAMNELIQQAVMEYATNFVTNHGTVFVEGREHSTAQVLLRMWSIPDNEPDVAHFLKVLKHGRQAYEKADKVLCEPYPKIVPTRKPRTK